VLEKIVIGFLSDRVFAGQIAAAATGSPRAIAACFQGEARAFQMKCPRKSPAATRIASGCRYI
jgi:hypothetical protein